MSSKTGMSSTSGLMSNSFKRKKTAKDAKLKIDFLFFLSELRAFAVYLSMCEAISAPFIAAN